MTDDTRPRDQLAPLPLLDKQPRYSLAEPQDSPSALDPFYAEQVSYIAGQYRWDETSDPQMYAAAMAALLSEYPRDVILYAVDPRTGFATKYSRMPQVFEARQFLEDLMRPRREKTERDARVEQQLKDREEWERQGGGRRTIPATAVNYREFLELVAQGKAKPRPIGAFEPGGYLGPEYRAPTERPRSSKPADPPPTADPFVSALPEVSGGDAGMADMPPAPPVEVYADAVFDDDVPEDEVRFGL